MSEFPCEKKRKKEKNRKEKEDQGCFKTPYQLQQVCQTVTAYWSTDKGRLCGRGWVFSSSDRKICLFFKAPLATLKSTTTAPRPHRSVHLTIRSLEYIVKEDNPLGFIGI